jgi:hypothetical protein
MKNDIIKAAIVYIIFAAISSLIAWQNGVVFYIGAWIGSCVLSVLYVVELVLQYQHIATTSQTTRSNNIARIAVTGLAYTFASLLYSITLLITRL